MYDTIIIGAGPAGMSAAIYSRRREMQTLILSKETGGQMLLASEIENYPGFKSIDSFDLVVKMEEQVKALGVDMKPAEATSIKKNKDGTFTVNTHKEKFNTRTIIIAMGLTPRRLAIPGEMEFTGKGVSYCANCDGPLYRDKTVAVVGGGNSALDAAEVLSKIAKQVYLVHRREEFRGFEALVDEVKNKANIKQYIPHEVKEIIGQDLVTGIKIINKKTKAEETLKIDGLFIEIGRIASTDLVEHLVKRDKWDQIIVDEKCRTKTAGVFAAGDVTPVAYKQITIASGQGTIAALAAYEYIQLQSGKEVSTTYDRSKPKVKA